MAAVPKPWPTVVSFCPIVACAPSTHFVSPGGWVAVSRLGGAVPLVPQATMINPASQVAELIRVVVKGLRALQMYLPNNPVYQRSVQSLQAAFGPVWEFTDHLVLAVVESDLIWEQEVVYEQPHRSESFAWLLYKDGMRFLTLRKGIEADEIVRFLQVVNRARLLTADAGDDLLTLLWAEDFQCIDYRFAEVVAEGALVLDPQAVDLEAQHRPEETAHVIREEYLQERPAGMVTLDDFDSTLYFLEEGEVETLQTQVQQEYTTDIRPAALDILFDVFELHAEPEVRDEVLAILEQLLPGLLLNGEFGTVAQILREMRAVAARVELSATSSGQRFEGFEASLSAPEIVAQLLQSLDEAATVPEDEDLGELLRELRAPALETAVRFLPRLGHPEVRRRLEGAVDRLAEAHPRETTRLLDSGDPGALLGLLPVIGRLKQQGAVAAVGKVLGQPDPALRLAAVEALAAIGTAGAMGHLERALGDTDRTVRLAAIAAVTARGWKGALKYLETVINSRGEREDLERAERRQVFEAYAVIAGPPALDTLGEILVPRGLFRRKESAETRTCAAYAVARIRTPAARQLLEQIADDKELAVRNAATRALREWPA